LAASGGAGQLGDQARIGLLDGGQAKIHWIEAGPVPAPHAPDAYDDGRVVVGLMV
jgi:hypothetical protein